MSDADVLERGGREPWPLRRILAAMAALTLAAVALGAADEVARGREAAALIRCESAANDAVVKVWAPVVAMAGYVRPTLTQVPAGSTRDGIFRLVADEAGGRSARLTTAADRCAGIDIWWHHSELRQRRTGCVAALAAEARQLQAVTRDGRVAFDRQSQAACG